MEPPPNFILTGWDELDDFWSQYVDLDLSPDYVQPSTHDDGSTIVGSELDVPALTADQTLTLSCRSKTSPSLGPPEDPDLQFGPSPSKLNEGPEDLGLSPLDKTQLVQYMGGITINQAHESPSARPRHIFLDDPAGLSPKSPLSHINPASQSTTAPKKRGRKEHLSTAKRTKTAAMRKIKACTWCHIHKVEVGIPTLDT